ncbi:MAG: hypothetical protein AB7O44_29390 [Hyphomicrobiaceae bacterium]
MALIADYIASPEGFQGNKLPGGIGAALPARGLADSEAGFMEASEKVSEIGNSDFRAGAAREGAATAALLMKEVNFTAFVSGLVSGVFQAIVKSSIEQMEAYSSMIASVAKSLEQFMADNVSENQGRDHMAEKFPDLFEIGVDEFADSPQPRLKLREGVDEGDALKRVNNSLTFENGALKSLDLSDENVERALVIGARMQLAKQRQQLMASLVLMGINRIVITDGRLSAKVMYDFQARDARKLARTATAYDFARDQQGNLQTTWAGEGTHESGGKVDYQRDRSKDTNTTDYSADSYAKGTYKYEARPVMTAMSTASEASEAALTTRAQLAGNVEVNFKSDYLPLERMATPGMIAAIQGNSTPVDPNVVPSPRTSPTPAGGTLPAPTATTG